jgi:AICAR transformylase/IMP cyclohydrolase PurH
MILDELRSIRTETQSNGQAIARLETSMTTLIGNGQPGRVTLIEVAVDGLQRWRAWSVGVTVGGGAVIGAAAWVIEQLRK